MSFIDDFIYKVKTGRLFAGSEKADGSEKINEALKNNRKTLDAINRQLEEFKDKIKGLDEIKKDVRHFGSQIEVLDEMNKEFTVFETKLDNLKKTSKKVTTSESQSEMQKEQPPAIQPSAKKQIGPDIVIHFVYMDKKYIVEDFNLNFRQDMNTLRNRPDSFTYGGTMQITISGFLDPVLEEWMTQTYLTRDGEIRFLPNAPKITDSSLLTIFFSDAYCTACKKTIDVTTSGVLSTFTIAPRRVRIGNEEFENKWKRKEPLEFTIKSV